MTEAPTTQERYTRAVQSSSLRVEADVRGDADVLIAAGWCKSKFGGALMRLQAEWDGAERWGVKVPVRPTKRAIMAEAQVTMSKGVRKITAESMEAARKKLEAYYEAEMRKLAGALKSLPEVITMLELKLLLDGQGAELAAPLALYWLDPVCKVCNGTGLQAKSEKGCGKCREHPGRASVPGGDVGKGLLQLMDDLARAAGWEVKAYCKS